MGLYIAAAVSDMSQLSRSRFGKLQDEDNGSHSEHHENGRRNRKLNVGVIDDIRPNYP